MPMTVSSWLYLWGIIAVGLGMYAAYKGSEVAGWCLAVGFGICLVLIVNAL
jgi:hypothetical protein